MWIPLKLEAHQLSVMDVVRSVNESNLILPAGDVRIGPFDYNIYANSQVETMDDINRIPLKTVGQSSVLVGDIGEAKDAAQIQYNIVRVDGQRSAYLPVLKQGGDANTIAVVDGVKDKRRRNWWTCRRSLIAQGRVRPVGLREERHRESDPRRRDRPRAHRPDDPDFPRQPARHDRRCFFRFRSPRWPLSSRWRWAAAPSTP